MLRFKTYIGEKGKKTAGGKGKKAAIYIPTKVLAFRSKKRGKNAVLKSFAEHFQEMLNRPPPDETADVPVAEEDLNMDIDTPMIMKKEIV